MTERETKERVLLLLALLVLLLFLFLLFLLLLLSVALYEQKTIRNSVNRPRETRKTITWMVKHDLKNNLPLQRPSLFSPFSFLSSSFPFLSTMRACSERFPRASPYRRLYSIFIALNDITHSLCMHAASFTYLHTASPFYTYLMCYDAVVLSAFCCSHNCNVSVLQHLFSSSIQYCTVSVLLIVLSAILWTYFYISFPLYKMSFFLFFLSKISYSRTPRSL